MIDLHKLQQNRAGISIFLVVFMIFFLGLNSCGEQPEEEAGGVDEQSYDYQGTIIAVGDSLTAGLGVAEDMAYPARLERQLQENGYQWQVINAGVSGETSSGMLSRIRWIISRQPDVVILESGANDALRGIPVSVVRENISKAVRQLQEANITVVLAGMRIVQNLGPNYTGNFAALYGDIAEEYDVILIPFFLEGVAGNRQLNQGDTIHPTAAGYEVVSNNVYPHVVQAIKQAERPASN